ncbi:MAG: glycosyltransferase family 2 protein [Deltaproteobacteria bacterium]|nr:MAG: glycosyltransferase family 2 protein [Deltaproteobacteria bacterium]
MELTVAICTAGRPGPCADAVADVVAQLPDAAECLVIDQSPPEQHRALAEALPSDSRVLLSHSAVRELPHARNLALSRARGVHVIYLDDDVRLGDGVLAGLSATLDRAGVGGAVPRIHEHRVRPNRPPVVNRVGPGGRVLTNLDGAGQGTVHSLKGCAMAFRTEVLRDVGGFDRRYGGTAFLEDTDASERVRRLGLALHFVGDVRVEHLSAPSGGVRMPESLHHWWRFHNTGLFLATHRGPVAVARGRLTFAAVAARFAASWRRPAAVPELMEAYGRGVAAAASPPALLS